MEAEQRERVPRLLLEAVESLPEPDRKLVLEHLIDRSLMAPRGGAGSEQPAGAGDPPAIRGILSPNPAEQLSALRVVTPEGRTWTISEVMGMPDEALRGALRDAAGEALPSEPTMHAILRLLADGRSIAEVATELGISEDEVTAELERPRPLGGKLWYALRARLLTQDFTARQSAVSYLRAPGPAGQQLVPVRFPEETHVRLKEWCASNGFSMAVVIRGLVDRFLDEYDPREA